MKTTTVFVLQHVAREDRDDEDVKFIGVYSSRQAAQSALQRLRGQPGFSEYPDGFSVDEYQLDEDHWCEGFVSQDASTSAPPSSIPNAARSA
jgi:homoserine kinase type II